MTTKFERDTAVTRRNDDEFDAAVDPGWLVHRGPNGGYVAAIILRALTARVDDATRAPRSFTVHYVSPAEVGPICVTTAIERTGRSVTSCSARLHQDGRLVALAVAAFAAPRPGPAFCDVTMPDVVPAHEIPAVEIPADSPEIARRWDMRWALGDPPWAQSPPSSEAVAGGWIRLEDPQPADACVVAAITDAWVPPVFSRIREAMIVPTVDLTIHFRSQLPPVEMAPDDYVFAVFRTDAANEGFLEESGEVWSASGALLAQSRQLAAVIPFAR